jgi:hypothetical protein
MIGTPYAPHYEVSRQGKFLVHLLQSPQRG